MPGLFESLLHQPFAQEIRGCWCLHSPDRLAAIPETDPLAECTGNPSRLQRNGPGRGRRSFARCPTDRSRPAAPPRPWSRPPGPAGGPGAGPPYRTLVTGSRGRTRWTTASHRIGGPRGGREPDRTREPLPGSRSGRWTDPAADRIAAGVRPTGWAFGTVAGAPMCSMAQYRPAGWSEPPPITGRSGRSRSLRRPPSSRRGGPRDGGLPASAPRECW